MSFVELMAASFASKLALGAFDVVNLSYLRVDVSSEDGFT